MTRTSAFCLILTLSLQAVGCHCCGVSERFGDRVDWFADQGCTLDNCYRPGLDLTRICPGCNKIGQRYCPPVPIYPASQVQMPVPSAPADYSPDVPPIEPMPAEPTPAEPPSMPELDAAPLDVPAPPPPADASTSSAQQMIQDELDGLSIEQLKEIIRGNESQILQASAQAVEATPKAEPVPAIVPPRPEQVTKPQPLLKKSKAQRPIAAPAAVPPSLNYRTLYEKLSKE